MLLAESELLLFALLCIYASICCPAIVSHCQMNAPQHGDYSRWWALCRVSMLIIASTGMPGLLNDVWFLSPTVFCFLVQLVLFCFRSHVVGTNAFSFYCAHSQLCFCFVHLLSFWGLLLKGFLPTGWSSKSQLYHWVTAGSNWALCFCYHLCIDRLIMYIIFLFFLLDFNCIMHLFSGRWFMFAIMTDYFMLPVAHMLWDLHVLTEDVAPNSWDAWGGKMCCTDVDVRRNGWLQLMYRQYIISKIKQC